MCSLQVIAWDMDASLVETKDYEDGIVWAQLAEADIVSGFDPNILRKAIAARDELDAAKQKYKIKALGADYKEEGSYEDYQRWLELPGIPMVRF